MAARVFVPGTPSDSDDDDNSQLSKTSTPFLSANRRHKTNIGLNSFDVSTIEPAESNFNLLNETVVAVPKKERDKTVGLPKPQRHRRVMAIESSSSEDEGETEARSVDTVLGTPSTSIENVQGSDSDRDILSGSNAKKPGSGSRQDPPRPRSALRSEERRVQQGTSQISGRSKNSPSPFQSSGPITEKSGSGSRSDSRPTGGSRHDSRPANGSRQNSRPISAPKSEQRQVQQSASSRGGSNNSPSSFESSDQDSSSASGSASGSNSRSSTLSSDLAGPLANPGSNANDSTLPIHDITEHIGKMGIRSVVEVDDDSVELIDDLAGRLNNVSIAKGGSKASKSRSASSSPEIVEVDHKYERGPVRVPPPAPKAERKGFPPAGAGPAQRQMIFLPLIPERPDILPDHLRGTVGELISKLQKIVATIPEDDGVDDMGPPDRLRVPLYSHQKYGLKWLWWRESKKPYGGILADEMGLGKTVMILALICRSKDEGIKENLEDNRWRTKDDFKRLVPSRTTLVVCPPSVLGQWEDEINKKSRGMKVLSYHGQSRTKSSAVLAQYDIVLTTFSTLSSEIPKLSEQTAEACRSPVLRVHWERIVLDEGHIIRNPKTGAAQAVSRLTAQFRWVVTGTPVHNKASDMYSLVKFLRLSPFDDDKVWDGWIGMKAVNKNGAERLNILAKSLVLRRTKDEVMSDRKPDEINEMTTIPPKTVLEIFVELSEEERLIYDHLNQFAQKEFRDFLKSKESRMADLQKAANNFIAGKRVPKNVDDKGFAHLFTMILRLRQCAVLPWLISSMIDDDDEDLDSSYDPAENIVTLKNPIFNEEYKSAKLERIYEDVDKIKRECRAMNVKMDKIVIVSQWTSLLKIIDRHLKYKGYSTATISGEVKISDRTDIMMKFNSEDKRPQIVLLSLAAGGVGLNLIGANHLFFVDAHWNPQLELQAQDRIHRFGQRKPVTIRRYISRDTIEDRVVELQQQKLQLADGILNNAQKKTGSGLNIIEMRQLFGV